MADGSSEAGQPAGTITGVFGRWLASKSCCVVQPRTNSATSISQGRRSGEPGSAAPPAVQPSEASGLSAEAADVLHQLPSIRQRTSAYPRSSRGSLIGYERLSKPSFGADARAAARRPAFPSRTLGSLTAWQMLAADVLQEMDRAAEGRRDSHASELQERCGGEAAVRGRSSHVEPGLVMSEDSGELLHAGEALASDAFQPGSTGGSGDAGAVDAGTGRFQAEFRVLGELGRGAFGCALKALRLADGALVCLKVMDTLSLGATEQRMTRDEVRVLSSLHHPNIVRYDDCFFEAGQQYISLELCEEGDLEQLIKGRGGALLGEDDVMLKFVQLCLALQHVHGKGILHRDIKSSNIFLSRHGILKLGDFGISKQMAPGKSYAKTMVGTPYYFSPEVVEDRPYNKKSDVWAAGCVLYELATLQRPFKGGSVSAIAVKILRGSYAPLPEQYSPELRQLVAALLRRKPEQRPSIDEILGMQYVRRAMRAYREHVQRTVEARKASYFHSLDSFDLDGGAAELAAARCSAADAAQGRAPAERRAAAGGGGAAQQGAGGGCAEGDATVVVKVAAATGRPASPDLASALAAAGSLCRPVAGASPPPPPKHSTFSAVEHLARVAAAGAARQPNQGQAREAAEPAPSAQAPAQEGAAGDEQRRPASYPASPRSMLLPGFASLETTGSGAMGRPASAASLAAASSLASGGGASADEAAGAPHSSPDHPAASAAVIGRAADSVGDLMRRVPALLDQVRQLLEQQLQREPRRTAGGNLEGGAPPGCQLGDGGCGRDGEDKDMQRRLSRRAAVQECLEELHSGILQRLGEAPPASPR